MTQSVSQGEVASIEQFLEMSDGISCSIFIDSSKYQYFKEYYGREWGGDV